MPAASEHCATSRYARGSTGTSTRQRWGEGAARGLSVVATRAAGRPTCATCRALRTDHTARRSETDLNVSATAPDSATYSVDQVCGAPLSDAARKPTGRARIRPRHRGIGSSLVARRERVEVASTQTLCAATFLSLGPPASFDLGTRTIAARLRARGFGRPCRVTRRVRPRARGRPPRGGGTSVRRLARATRAAAACASAIPSRASPSILRAD
jgi:hypothetical protein